MSARLNDIWDMIIDLEPKERRIIYKRLQEDVRYKLNGILDNVNERLERDEITLDEITREVEIVREVNHGEN